MPYTVQQLAKLSGVSIRTLHFYDEIGLLKPAYYGKNNYRYYEEEQLLKLQQILFYRQLDFQLNEIQNMLSNNHFDKIEALKSHRHILKKNLDRTHKLIKTIDKTISHLTGEAHMKHEELYYGFDSEQQKQYEQELLEKNITDQATINKYKNWGQQEQDDFIQEAQKINEDLIIAINKKLNPASLEVQEIIRRHHTWVGWNPTREKYIALSQLYQTPEFKQFYHKLHPKLLAFIVEAMQIFADQRLQAE